MDGNYVEVPRLRVPDDMGVCKYIGMHIHTCQVPVLYNTSGGTVLLYSVGKSTHTVFS